MCFPDAREQLRAEPASVNVLPGYGNDPRVVSNLVDGVLRTCDDQVRVRVRVRVRVMVRVRRLP